MWSGERLTKIQSTTRPDHLWLYLWTKFGKAAQKREKQEWANEKPKLDNARRLRGICFIDPEDGEYKETIKNARRKLEVPMDAAMPCKKGTKKLSSFQETEAKSCESNKIPETKHAGIIEAHESTRQRLESSPPKGHEDHTACKGFTSMTQFSSQVYAFASSDENSGCESSSGQGMGEARNDSWKLTKLRAKRMLFWKHRETKRKSTLIH